jgi:hypothetical protein
MYFRLLLRLEVEVRIKPGEVGFFLELEHDLPAFSMLACDCQKLILKEL